jgi:hypothetical protein
MAFLYLLEIANFIVLYQNSSRICYSRLLPRCQPTYLCSVARTAPGPAMSSLKQPITLPASPAS